jgi:hypothetical protein
MQKKDKQLKIQKKNSGFENSEVQEPSQNSEK